MSYNTLTQSTESVGGINFAYKEATMYSLEQQHLFPIPLSLELQILYNAAQHYDWERIKKEIGSKFKEASEIFHRKQKQSPGCPNKNKSSVEVTFFDLDDYKGTGPLEVPLNPKGAGKNPQPFLAYLKAVEFAPILHIEQNMEAIALHLRSNSDYLRACGFNYPPSTRALQDFDQIMSENHLWERFREQTYQVNVDSGLINESKEDTLNIDNTHVLAYSTPNKVIKQCRECSNFNTCSDKVSTDETADWYVKSKCKIFYAHQIGISQLAQSGAPLERVVLSGRQYEPDSLEPLLNKQRHKYENIKLQKINADGIFNTQTCKDTIQRYYPFVELYSPINPKGRLKDFEQPARGIKKVTKHGNVKCIAGHQMVFLSKDENLQAYMFGCPVFNPEARAKLINMGIDVSNITCSCKEQCAPRALNGRLYRAPRKLLKKVNWDRPQFSYRYWFVYKLRTKIERLFGRMKKRFKMAIIYRRGLNNIEAHIDKFMALINIMANIQGYYPV